MIIDGHVCRLEERFYRRSGVLQWSLPRKELCHCQAVVAPRKAGSQTCSSEDNEEMDVDLWFTDDPIPLVNRRNWDKVKLDKLLDRDFCCTFFIFFIQFLLLIC